MKPEEAEFHQQLRSASPDDDRPEIAEKYAQWLLNEKRYHHAALITYSALIEGPRFDLYELRAMSNLTNLENLWKEIHRRANRKIEKYGGAIYNEGLSQKDPDWKSILQKISNDLSSGKFNPE